MFILENIRSALDAIRSNKLRSGLTMLGIIIGVASVVMMVAIGKGAQAEVTSRLESMGTNLLIVQPGSPSQTDVRSFFRRSGGGGSASTLTLEDAQAIKDNIKNLRGVSPELRSNYQLINGNLNMSASVVGAGPDYPLVNNFSIEYGSFVDENNLKNREKVIVLGTGIIQTLFPDVNPIGRDVRVGENIFTIIGTMETKGQQGFINYDEYAFVPITTMQKRLMGVDTLSAINISVENQSDMEKVLSGVTDLLMKEHRINSAEDQDFNVLNQAQAVETLNEVTQTFTFLLGGIAAISLLVGGIGVMNIMLVSVTERTREIGIRNAIGAKKSDILQQFIVEAVVLSVFGGAIGILISFLGAWLITEFVGTRAIISSGSVFLAFAFSIIIGVIFGFLPAYKAASLKPIDALRYE